MTDRPLGFGELLDSGFAIYRKGFLSFIGIAALGQVPPALLAFLLAGGAPQGHGLGPDLVVVTLVSWLLSTVMAGAVVSRAASFFGLGEGLGIGSAYQVAFRRYTRLLGFSLLYGVAIAVGLLLFIVPGIIAAVWFSLGFPAILLEDIGVLEAFRRSLELARGAFWRLFGVLLVTYGIAFVGAAIVEVPFRGLSFLTGRSLGSTVLPLLGSVVGNVLLAGLVEIMETVLYVDRRTAEEGTAFVAP